MREVIQKLNMLLTHQQKRFLLILFGLTIVLSLIETIGISAIMPFISMASNPNILDNGYYSYVYNFFGFESKNLFIIVFGFSLIGFYILRAIYSVFYSYSLNRFSFGTYNEFAYRLFKGYINLPYKDFVTKNTSLLTKNIMSEAQNLSNLVQHGLIFVAEFFTVLFLYALLLAVDWQMTLVLSIVLGIKVFSLTKVLSKIVKKEGKKRSEFQAKFMRIISETFGNFKLVKLYGNEHEIFKSFENANSNYTKSNIIYSTINQIPRGILETLGFSILIGIVLYILFRYQDASFVIPIISMYALALYRMLPAINRIMISYNGMIFLQKSLDIVHDDLTYIIEPEGNDVIRFNTSLTLSKVSFDYNKTTNVLHDISLTIHKGDRIAFIGESGSGKSTLVDIIIGVYKPSFGLVMIDDTPLSNANIKAWRAKIGYIPQSIYLLDGTVGENVSFGHEYDEMKIINALQKANIWEFLLSKDGIHTRVGEGGIQLSGGQKQRIGIARALYSAPDILVLDEATSALDTETEASIMNEIYAIGQDKTLIVIAHRLSTLQGCSKIIQIKNGKLIYE